MVCKTRNQYPETKNTELLRKIYTDIPDISYNIEIILISSLTDLKYHISLIYETRIAHGFSNIYTFLHGFTKPVTNHFQNNVNIIPKETLRRSIKDYLSNIYSMSDINKVGYLTDLTTRLAHVCKCSIVLPLSVKFSIPQWLCNHLLHEIQFEEALANSVSADAKIGLEKLKQLYTSFKAPVNAVNKAFAFRKLSKHIVQKFVLDSLIIDFDMVIIKSEKVMTSMKSLTVVMSKMMFEIVGYMRQTNVPDVPCPQTISSLDIPFILRKEIME